jgi:hypothetical protein
VDADEAGTRRDELLKRLAEIVRPFGLERRLEDEPAHYARVVAEIAGAEAPR